MRNEAKKVTDYWEQIMECHDRVSESVNKRGEGRRKNSYALDHYEGN